jgi:predicted phage-related endonuclease
MTLHAVGSGTAATRFRGATQVGTWPTGSDEWLAARMDRLGGSEIAAVLGLSPFESRFSLWHRKVGTIGPVDETPEMEWGKRLEPVIIQKLADVRSLPLFRGAMSTGFVLPDKACLIDSVGSWVSDAHPFAIANPDALLWDGNDWTVVETKFSYYGDGFGEQHTDQVPIHYRQQVTWYMGVLGIRQAIVAVLVGGCDYREFVIDFDPDEFGELVSAGAAFLDDVANDVEPDIDAHSATYDAIKEMHPDIWPEDVELSDETGAAFVLAQHAVKEAKAHETYARSLVADEMGNAKRATWLGHRIARRQARGDGTPYVVAERNLPSAVDAAATINTEGFDPFPDDQEMSST